MEFHDIPTVILPFRKRYVKMRESLVRFRSLVHMYVNRKRYIKVHEVCFERTIYLHLYPEDATFHAQINHSSSRLCVEVKMFSGISVLCLQMKFEAQRKAEEERRRREMVSRTFGHD